MTDPRVKKLASLLVSYSTAVRPGEKVLIEDTNVEIEFVKALVDAVHDAGGMPFVSLKDRSLDRTLFARAGEEQMRLLARFELDRMKEMDVYIGFTSLRNSAEWSDLPPDKLAIYNRYVWKQVHVDQRLSGTRWVVLRYPSAAFAQLAGMSEDAFEEFFFNVCTLDYGKMSKAMDGLTTALAQTDRVRIISPGTDLTFSVKGLPAIKCDGHLNIPDGEVYTAPVRDSVNGIISYNAPSDYHRQGFLFENVTLEFEDGRIVNATANDTERANQLFDLDEGARYVGEFAIGLNPYVTRPMKETLFDEKIAGSIHFTPGNAYADCFNGNRSALHWDLVLIQTPEWGGGELWFDDRLVRKDGRFVVSDLEALNPERLLSA